MLFSLSPASAGHPLNTQDPKNSLASLIVSVAGTSIGLKLPHQRSVVLGAKPRTGDQSRREDQEQSMPWSDRVNHLQALLDKEQFEDAKAYCTLCLNEFRQKQATPAERLELSTVLSTAAQVFRFSNCWPETIQLWKECYELVSAPGFPNPLSKGAVGVEYAFDLVQSEREEDQRTARTIFKESLRKFFEIVLRDEQIDRGERAGGTALALCLTSLRRAGRHSENLGAGLDAVHAFKGAMRVAERYKGDGNYQTAQIRAELGDFYVRHGDFDAAAKVFESLIKKLPEASQSGDPKVVLFFSRLAEIQFERNKTGQARSIATAALGRLPKDAEGDEASRCFAMLHHTLGRCDFKARKYVNAVGHFDAASHFEQRTSVVELRFLIDTFDLAARALFNYAGEATNDHDRDSRLNEADLRHKAAISFVSQAPAALMRERLVAHQNYFNYLSLANRHTEALDQAVLLEKLAVESDGTGSAAHIDALRRLADAFEEAGSLGRAEAMLGKAVEHAMLLTRNSGTVPLEIIREHAHVLFREGASEAGIQVLLDGVQASAERSGRTSHLCARAHVELAYGLVIVGEYPQAQAILDAVLPIFDELKTVATHDHARALHYRALTEIRGGEEPGQEAFEQALLLLREAEGLYEALHETSSVLFADLQADLGQVLVRRVENSGSDTERIEAIRALRACDTIYRARGLDRSRSHMNLLEELVGLLEGDDSEDATEDRARLEKLKEDFPDEGEVDS